MKKACTEAGTEVSLEVFGDIVTGVGVAMSMVMDLSMVMVMDSGMVMDMNMAMVMDMALDMDVAMDMDMTMVLAMGKDHPAMVTQDLLAVMALTLIHSRMTIVKVGLQLKVKNNK